MDNFSSPWFFIEIGNTWSRVFLPDTIKTMNDLFAHIRSGVELDIYNLVLPARTRIKTRTVGKYTVIGTVGE